MGGIYQAEKTVSPKMKGKQGGKTSGHPNKSLKLHGKLGISNSSLILKHSMNKFKGANPNDSFVNIGDD